MADPKNNTYMACSRLGLGRKTGLALVATLALSAAGFSTARAQTTTPSDSAQVAPDISVSAVDASTEPGSASVHDVSGTISLEAGKARRLSSGHKIKKATILNPDLADVTGLSPSELLINGKKAGMTQLVLLDENDHSQVLNVSVESDLEALRRQLKIIFPETKIMADMVAGTITLRGQVHSLQAADDVTKIATPYGAKVLNLLEVAGEQQVMLHVKFAEISKTASSELGVNFGFTDGKSFFASNVGQVNAFGTLVNGAAEALTSPSPGGNVAVFGQGAAGRAVFQYFIKALETNNLLRMLAEPDLVATSGQEASFQAGGSFPIPVPQAGSGGSTPTITIQFQDFGVILHFTPIVLGDGRIRLKVSPEVSELDFANAVNLNGFFVPGLTKRNVKTTVELAEGQTFAIAGLLQNSVTASNTQFPLLGDLPILGTLFRSVQYQRNETELVVLVTPVIVHGMDPADVTEVPGGKWRDPFEKDLYLKKDLGGPIADADRDLGAEKGPAPEYRGAYGFRPVSDASPTAVSR
jgi:pilus assembly protein CpaC